MTALSWYPQTSFTNHSTPLELDIMVYKLAFYIWPTAPMFFLNIWTYFDLDKSTFQKFIRKAPIPICSFQPASNYLYTQKEDQLNQIKDLIIKKGFGMCLSTKNPVHLFSNCVNQEQ